MNNKKVVMMNAKERVETKSKMRDIKTFLMRLSNDPKLELDGCGLRSGDTVADEQNDRLNKTDDTARGRGESCNKVCSRFNDPKLELEYVGGGMRRGVMAEGDDRVSKADDVAGGRGEKIAVVCGSWESLDNVSTNEYLSNLCYTELVRVDIACVRGDDDGEPGQEHQKDCTSTPEGDHDGLA